MKRQFLGDSYDAVKRMWREILANWAPLYAEPSFFPDEQLCPDFTKLTGIQMLTNRPLGYYSILNDPHTGIWLPTERIQSVDSAHVNVAFVADQLRDKDPRCVVTFDQSHYRNCGHDAEKQRRIKMLCLLDLGFPSFYYVSHAPFLFATPDAGTLHELRRLLVTAGIPDRDDRLQTLR